MYTIQEGNSKYTVRYHCGNCGHDFSKQYPQGQLASAVAVCTNCGCRTAKKMHQIAPTVTSRHSWFFNRESPLKKWL